MSNKIENYLISFGEELGKEGYSIVKAGVNTFYKAKGEMAAYTIDNYMNTRFKIRLEDFAYEQERLSRKQRERFYENIDDRQLNFLFELLEKARTSTYDLHAKILARLYGNLILNGNLNYHESTFLANINIMNDEDIFTIYNFLKDKKDFEDFNKCVIYKVSNFQDLNTYNKCLLFGIVIEMDTTGMFAPENNELIKDKACHLTSFSKELFALLGDVINYYK